MTIFAVTPLTPVTPATPVSNAEALARAAMVQTVDTLGAMIGQSHSDVANSALKDAAGDSDVARAKAAEAVRATVDPETVLETPARAVAVAAGRAAARQAGLAPLMADMAQAAAEPSAPAPVKAAIDQVMALGARMDGQISGPEIRQALQRSGLFLEARLAAATPGEEVSRPVTGTLTAPPKVVPTPTPNSDMKAALLVFREVVKTWMDSTPATSAQAEPTPSTQPPASPPPASPPSAAALAAAVSAQMADRGTPQALAAAPQAPAAGPTTSAATAGEPVDQAPAPVQTPEATEATPQAIRPPGGWPSVNAPAPAAPKPQPAPALPAFGAIVAEDFQAPSPTTPLVTALATPRVASAAVMAYGGPEIAPGPPSQTPPPYAGAPTHAQAAAQPSLPPGSDPRAMAHRLLSGADAALARNELLQIASLPDAPAPGRPVEDHTQRWVFDMPFMTPQGPAAAQFEISRDGGGGSGGEGGRAPERTWRARFSLDVEPMGPVHAQVALTGDRARVSLWAERPSSMARLRGDEDRLGSALREAALEPEIAFHAGQPRTAAAAPGQFLDQAT